MEPAERDRNAEKIERARDALSEYAATDPEIPVGGLSPTDYERWRRDTEDLSLLTPSQQFGRAWLELEYAMAMMRGGFDHETEEPYDDRKIRAAFEAARQQFAGIAKNESAPADMRMRARIASASVPLHREIITGKGTFFIQAGPPKLYVSFLSAMHSATTEMLSAIDTVPEYAQLLHELEVMVPLTAQVFLDGWYLPAPPRQPWDITVHSGSRNRPDIYLVVNGEKTKPHYLEVDTSTLIPDDEDTFGSARRFVDAGADYTVRRSRGRRAVAADRERALRTDELGDTANVLIEQINGHLGYLEEIGVRPAEKIIDTIQNQAPPERDIFEEVTWYLLEYTPATSRGVLEAQVALLERRRREERLRPDEQRVLGWMQLELAQVMALEDDLDAAREEFGMAIDTFVRSQRMFMRERRPGDAHDAVLAQAATEVYRALYTSRDKEGRLDRYALRRAISSYVQQVAAIFASANTVKATDAQMAVLYHTVNRATLILLQQAAHETLRHLVLPVSPRTTDVQDVMALHIEYDTRVSGYDIANPIAVRFADGSEISAADHLVTFGQNALTVFGTPTDLLNELTSLLQGGRVTARIGKKAGKTKRAAPKGGGKKESDEVEELSTELANAISDAYEYQVE